MSLEIGDNVIVRQGIKAPDSEEVEIGGWQGRIIKVDKEISKDNILITIEWDSLTLEQLPSKFIQESEIKGFDWKIMNLCESDLNKTVPRDKANKVKKIQRKISENYYWASFGDEGLRISHVLGKVDQRNEMKCLEKWDKFLDENLSFPIHVIVDESEDSRIIKTGDNLIIKSLSNCIDMYGIIAKVKFQGNTYHVPLCDLDVEDKGSMNYQLINDYRTWFSNK